MNIKMIFLVITSLFFTACSPFFVFIDESGRSVSAIPQQTSHKNYDIKSMSSSDLASANEESRAFVSRHTTVQTVSQTKQSAFSITHTTYDPNAHLFEFMHSKLIIQPNLVNRKQIDIRQLLSDGYAMR